MIVITNRDEVQSDSRILI